MDLPSETSTARRQMTNVCRCCLGNNCYKDISAEYYFSGQKEVYEDMLRDALCLEISQHNSSCNRLICEDCITRLRDAFHFKQMVRQSEEQYRLFFPGSEIDAAADTKPEESDFKDEQIKIECLAVDVNTAQCDEYVGDESFDDDDEILANIKLELTKSEEKVCGKRQRKKTDENNARKRAKIKNNDDTEQLRAQSKSDEKDWLKIVERRGNGPLLRENSLKLLANSTICVFQWHKSRYRCFCCKEPFSDMNLLREHTNKRHTIENIEKIIILQQNRLVKVEISIIQCKLCGNRVDNLITLRNHLENHGINFDLNEDLLVPFKIGAENLQCQICQQSFNMFRLLNIHMNKHYQKQVCHICGAGFSNLVFLNLHKTRSHRPLSCKECNLFFTNKIDKKDHDVSVHNLKIERKLRFPCPYCHERFFQENFRVQHLVDKHGMKKPEYRCNMCTKVFITRSLCNNHVKNVHLKEKNHECDVCHHLFYTKSDVARHRVTHTGEKKFSCTLCNNLFATKDSLRRHMKRTHAAIQ